MPMNQEAISTAVKHAGTKVVPQWLADNKTFWYRRQTTKNEFIKVNAETRIREHAFNHEAVGKALSEVKGEDIDPYDLPFNWIEMEDNKFRFRDGVDVWQYNGQLHRHEGKLTETELESKPWLKKTERDGGATSVVFINTLSKDLSLLWLDRSGSAHSYGTVKAGSRKTQSTYAGHVWRLADNDENTIGVYKAVSNASTVILDESTDAHQDHCERDSEGTYQGLKEDETVAVVNDDTIWIKRQDGTTYEVKSDLPKGHKWKDDVDESLDGSLVVAWDQWPGQDSRLHLIESSPPDQLRPKLRTEHYLRPGDDVEVLRPRLFDVESSKELPVSNDLFDNPFNITTIGWNNDNSEFRFIYNQRGHQVLRVIGISRTGGVRVIIEETSNTFIDYSQKLHFDKIEGTDELIWASERDGWNRLYLVDASSSTPTTRPLTPANQVVVSVERIDVISRSIWYTVRASNAGEEPYYDQLVRVSFDGTGYVHLTQGHGTHTWSWSPDHRYLVDTWSTVDQAPKTVLRDGETGDELMVLEEGSLDPLLNVGWLPPERFDAPGRDNEHQIYGIIIKPSDFDPSKRYPIIEHIYAGPQDFFVPKSFGLRPQEQESADLGFVIVMVDGMGTNWRGKAFHDVCYKNLKDAGFPDRIAWMKAAATTRPWMDLSRVGIYGTSAGGQNAMGALLFHGEFYKIGIADSGCHDNRMDKMWWNEQWMGWPVDEAYKQSSNVVNAHKLEGKLMLMVGELDDNVDPASTMQVVKALNDAGKDYELVVFPGKGHGCGTGTDYGRKRMRGFFKRHLLE